MEFWGHEVKPGATVACEAGDGFVVHLSQVALGETKKASENVIVFVKVGDQKLVIATLSVDKHPQISCDLIFDEAFELSHNSKTTSVFLCGYKSVVPDMFESDSGEDEDEEMEIEIPVKNNKADKSVAKVSAKDVKKDKQDNEDDLSDSDSEHSMSEDASTDEDITSSGTDDLSGDDSEDDSEDESEDEETPVPEVGKKRTAKPDLKPVASDKKARISTPKKESGDKKEIHVATPHPAKKASKAPADGKPKEKAPKTPTDSKAKDKSPKSGSHSCKSCSKAFNSAGDLESHQKAKKHEA